MNHPVPTYNTTLRNIERKQRARKKKLSRLGLLVLTIVLLLTCTRLLVLRRNHVQVASVSTIATPVPTSEASATLKTIIPIIKDPLILTENSTELEKAAQKGLEGTKGNYSIVIKHLSTNESYASQEHRKFQTGSLYKLWVMATAYQQIKQGTLKKDDVMKSNIDTLYKAFNLNASYSDRKEGEITLTVEEALERMITISDNDASLLLTKRVGSSKVATFLKDNGFLESEVSSKNRPPTSTAYDMALFFDRLQQGKLIDPQYSTTMLDLLKRQRLNQKIPKYLPKDIQVAHKTGELDGYSHDAGIVYTEEGNYLFVMLSESTARLQANERLALVSKEVYSYFSHSTSEPSSENEL